MAARSSFCGTSLQQAGLRWRQPKQERCMQVVQAGMFDTLSKGLDKAWDMVRKDGKLTKENIKAPLREIRRALLEADVSLPVVRQFVRKVEEAALGVKVVKGVRPDQQLVAVVNQELTALMGGQQEGLVQPEEGPQVILMAGLQGVGKTTACGKLALLLKNQGKKVLMVATDVYRPAAIDQLVSLGQRVGVDVFELGTSERPAEIARKGQQKAAAEGYDTVIVDTAGRLQIDDAMMTELKEVKAAVTPTDTLLVVDAMTGQEAAGLVKAFNDAANITGAILTKMDGDSRGGAALSVKAVSGKPIKFVGTGEKLTALEPFYPDRTAGRILDMGDILTLVEKAEQSIKASEAEEITKKIMQAKFDFNDFVKQYKMVTSMGTMGQLVKMFPGMNKISEKQLEQSEKEMKTFQAMIDSMTPKERSTPELLAKSPSRRRRIARGSGHKEVAVSTMIAKFSQMRSSMVNMSRMMSMGAMPGMPGMPQMSQEEMLQATLAGSGPRKVAAGKVRRKKGASRGLLELQNLRA
ncbi:hypothetical protein WJX72_007576 [[Myrmecia] bisecta]|uniref:signal-recognition-particle GTPase n=1 Tax=[Myrmecia] bisecta TaxID=41462 RepID=A0AAW1P2T0_9CHLO